MAFNNHQEKAFTQDSCNVTVFESTVAFSLELSSLWKRRNEPKSSGRSPNQVRIILAQKQHIQKANTSSTESITLSPSPGISEKLTCTVPKSAPPERISRFFAWPSPKASKPDADATRNSPSSCHKLATKTGDETRSNGRSPTSVSPDGLVSEEDDLTMNTRKPPFHLPPLDPSVFDREKKSKSSKPGGSRGKKKKRRSGSQSTATNFSTDHCQEKNNDENGTKTEEKFPAKTGGQYEWQEKIGYPNQELLCGCTPKIHPKKMAPGSPAERGAFPAAEDHGNGNPATQHQTLTKVPVIVRGEIKSRSPRRSSSFRHAASSVEVLPTMKATAQARCSSGAGERRGVRLRVSDHNHNSTRRNENLPGCFQRSPTSPENRNAAGSEAQFYQVVGVIRRSSSQPDLSQCRNCQAPRRVRRVGVCRETESTASMNERMQARVLMKKFGEINISK